VAPATQPAGAVAEAQPAPATQPADLKAAADERHKHLDPRWRQNNEAQRNAIRTRWADKQITHTFKQRELVDLSLGNGLLKVDTTDFAAPQPVRVAVAGSESIWMLSRPRAFNAFGGGSNLFSLTCYNLDAKDETPWQTRLFINKQTLSFNAQSVYGMTTLTQSNGIAALNVQEYTQMGQPMKMICTAQSPTLMQLRAEHPEEFRMYVMPLLSTFTDPAFLQPGPADVYSVFGEIPADARTTTALNQIIPQLDADDPADRDAASLKLRQIGAPAVLAALRLDESSLSEEQKLRLKSFIAGFRRMPMADPAAQRHNLSFLIDCLEFEDPAIRAAAKAELENQTHQTLNFDPALVGIPAIDSVDALRKQLLAAPPPSAKKPDAAPATQPAPQV
jgi:hypothetical protein